MVMLGVAVLVSLGYAAWAFTARRAIFVDLADGRFVSTSDATASDNLDAAFVIVAGLVSVLALLLWIVPKRSGRTTGGGLELGGLGVALLGIAAVVVGLYLAGAALDADGRTAQADDAAVATVITGVGFVVLAAGLVIGLLSVSGEPRTPPPRDAPGPVSGDRSPEPHTPRPGQPPYDE